MGKIKFYKKRRVALFSYFIVIVIGFAILHIRAYRESNKEFIIYYDGVNDNQKIVVETEIEKSWGDADRLGVQYKFTVINKQRFPIRDWNIKIVMPEDTRFNEGWNGEYELQDNILYFTPDPSLDVAFIQPQNKGTFGFILGIKQATELKEFAITGYNQANLYRYKSFYILLVMLIMGVAGVTVSTYYDARLKKIEKMRHKDERIIEETMRTFANIIDTKDEYTRGHSKRVSKYSMLLAEKLEFSKEDIRNIGYIGLMHDCGKIAIPDNILNKPGRLTEKEMNLIKNHTVIGAKILESFTAIDGIRDGVRYHHERYDGKGYPEGLEGEGIPLVARVICVADSFDAMNSDRCYRMHLPMDEIIKELEHNSGKQFDPIIVEKMLQLIRENRIRGKEFEDEEDEE